MKFGGTVAMNGSKNTAVVMNIFHLATAPFGLGRPHGRDSPITLRRTTESVGLPCTRDEPDAETSDDTQHSQDKGIHAPGALRTRNPCKRSQTTP
jgi:hypothetical protein